MADQLTRTSRFLSLLLRHKPETIGLELSDEGWAKVDELVALARAAGHDISESLLHEVVETNDKRRFAFSADGSRIRASQGHSFAVDLQFVPMEPPDMLFHGTVQRFLNSIRASGLEPRERQHVHLSHTMETAMSVGARRGTPVLLEVRAREMRVAGHEFFQSENGVWLTTYVPCGFIRFPD